MAVEIPEDRLLAVDIDGRIDPAEWAGARHIDDFRQTQPLTRAPGSQATEAWVLSTWWASSANRAGR